MRILAIETSCDETAAAVVEDGVKILSNVVASSHEMHEKYGGIVPEVAAREQLRCIIPTIQEALLQAKLKYTEVDAIAITVGPGLIGSLLIGVETAKTMAFVTGKLLIPVNHVLAHMYANFISSPKENSSRAESRHSIQFPALSLVVSGGHTELYHMESIKKLTWLGGTLDDAAGECFDKTARLLGFVNGGGPAIAQSASQYESSTIGKQQLPIKLPRPMMHDDTLNFSFSGLKTAILREVIKLKEQKILTPEVIQQLSFEVQEAITDVLVKKTLLAATNYGAKSILLSGGVSANLCLREKFKSSMYDEQLTMKLYAPPVPLCTDNAVYIASYAYFRGKQTDWHDVTAIPDLSVEE